jgi:hypothetical protein
LIVSCYLQLFLAFQEVCLRLALSVLRLLDASFAWTNGAADFAEHRDVLHSSKRANADWPDLATASARCSRAARQFWIGVDFPSFVHFSHTLNSSK